MTKRKQSKFPPSPVIYVQKPDADGRLLQAVILNHFPKAWRRYFHKPPLHIDEMSKGDDLVSITLIADPANASEQTLEAFSKLKAPLFVGLSFSDGTIACFLVIARAFHRMPINTGQLWMNKFEGTLLHVSEYYPTTRGK